MIHQGFTLRVFAKDSSGVYQGLPGDAATVTQVGGAFQLREKAAPHFVAFGLDGKLNYMQEPNGHRLTALYTGNQLSSVPDADGSTLSFTYNGQGASAR